MSEIRVIHGKMEEKLKNVPDNTYHSIVSDAPYGLGTEPDIVEVMKDWIEKGYHEIKGKTGGMMCLEWDKFVPQPIQWKEVYRTLRPGGYGLIACGTRTQHWMAASLRFAGFEIRDVICWHYGQGWPKSVDVSKAIDDLLGAKRPTEKKMTGDISNGNYVGKLKSPRVEKEVAMDMPQTKEAKKWHGYGTALKPATEFWTLVRKPLEEGLTVAQNVLKWGTGGMNIEACKIKTDNSPSEVSETGRYPSNLMLDEFSVEIMNQQTGMKTSGAMHKPYKYTNYGNTYGAPSGETKQTHESSTGYPSRFFYCAKASKSEKNKGLEEAHFKSLIKDGKQDLQNDVPQNTHISVKPVMLMRELVKLVTPKAGKCLDPFFGSGTTGIACKLEGFDCDGIEQEEAQCITAMHRIDTWEAEQEMPLQLAFFDQKIHL